MASTRGLRPETNNGPPIAYRALDVSAILFAGVYLGILHPCHRWVNVIGADGFDTLRLGEEQKGRNREAINLQRSSPVTLMSSMGTFVCSHNTCVGKGSRRNYGPIED